MAEHNKPIVKYRHKDDTLLERRIYFNLKKQISNNSVLKFDIEKNS